VPRRINVYPIFPEHIFSNSTSPIVAKLINYGLNPGELRRLFYENYESTCIIHEMRRKTPEFRDKDGKNLSKKELKRVYHRKLKQAGLQPRQNERTNLLLQARYKSVGLMQSHQISEMVEYIKTFKEQADIKYVDIYRIVAVIMSDAYGTEFNSKMVKTMCDDLFNRPR